MPVLPIKAQQVDLLSSRRVIWLASFPRSGNTFLRIVLRQCFGLSSASIYPDDVEGIRVLEESAGHIEYGPAMDEWLRSSEKLLVKTHEAPADDQPAIYVVRDGRPVCVSLSEFYGRDKLSLSAAISGAHRFGTWAQHVAAWHPWDRPNTLFLKYEDLVADLPESLRKIAGFLGAPVINEKLPEREELFKASGGRWIRRASRWESVFGEHERRLFDYFNGDMMRKLGYYASDQAVRGYLR
jgi:hypothetical protein